MTANEKAEAIRLAGPFDVHDFYPAEFPSDVPTVKLEKISLASLLNDPKEGHRLFETCRTTGFFYLDMLDHPLGRQLWRSACKLHQIGRDRFDTTPIHEKMTYRTRPGVRVFDRGCLMRTAYEGQHSADLEILNIPQNEFFGTKDTIVEGLPHWITPKDQNEFKEALQCGNAIAQSILSVLENQLKLPVRSLTELHNLTDDSGDFIRVLRYGGVPSSTKEVPEGFPPHRDTMSLAILFNWLGGLQIPHSDAKVDGFSVEDEDWRWVKPEPGYAIVNLGDAMSIFTNKVLKSQIHRVVKAPGEQRAHNRMSVIIATRPENTALMKSFESTVIPTNESCEAPITSLEWGFRVVSGIQERAVKRGATDLDFSVNHG